MIWSISFVFFASLASASGEVWSSLEVDPNNLGFSYANYSNACMSSTKGKFAFPFCDPSKDLEDRVNGIVGMLTLEEKIGLLGNEQNAAPSIKSSEYQIWNEALHGVANSPGVVFNKQPYASATMFPEPLHSSTSYNRSLFRSIGSVVGIESRSFGNHRQSGFTFWTPNINIIRDPRWGRSMETPGEDPKLNGDYAEDFVSHFQNVDPSKPTRQLMNSACCKHYAAYNLEHWAGEDRTHFNAVVTERDMKESYLPAFEACVTKGKVSCLMCSYNAINGVPSCANRDLMEKLARDTWHFDGYITGDCGAVANTFNTYHYKNHSKAEIVQDTLVAQVDVACDNFLKSEGLEAVKSGIVDIKLVDRALRNMFRVWIRLGMFDPDDMNPLQKISKVNAPEHHQLALQAAQQGVVLLKNDDHTLPLSSSSLNGELAVIGPHANFAEAMKGNYHGNPPFLVTILDGLKTVYSNSKMYQGCELKKDNSSEDLLKEAEKAASTAAQTILAVGIDGSCENEGHDRGNLYLPGRQNELIARVAKAAADAKKPPVVLVLVTGAGIDLSDVLENSPNVKAVLFSGYAGQSAGTAIAQALFGVINPSGKLTQTFYKQSFADQVDMRDMGMHPNKTSNNPGRTYKFFTGEPLWPFGHGLSYTDFHSEVQKVNRRTNKLEYTVVIKNTGPRAGEHIMLAFLRPPPEANVDLKKKLHTYFRTPLLQPGEFVETTIVVDVEKDLSLFLQSTDSTATSVPKFNDQHNWSLELDGANDIPLNL